MRRHYMKYVTSLFYFCCFSLLIHGKSKFEPCWIPGVERKVPGRLCELRQFLDTIENYTRLEDKKTWEEKYPFFANNFIMCGKQGLGKSTAGKNIARGIRASVKYYHAQEILESHDLIKKIYDEALCEVEKTKRPVIIVIDNIELFAKAKNGTELDVGIDARGVVTGFHHPLSEFENNPYIITIFTSDIPFSDIFCTYRKRLVDGLIEWSSPDREDRATIIKTLLHDIGHDQPSWLIELLAQASFGLTRNDIEKALCGSHDSQDSTGFDNSTALLRATYPGKGLMILMGAASLYLAMRFGCKGYSKVKDYFAR